MLNVGVMEGYSNLREVVYEVQLDLEIILKFEEYVFKLFFSNDSVMKSLKPLFN